MFAYYTLMAFFDVHEIWQFMPLVIVLSLIAFLVIGSKYGVLGIRFKFEKIVQEGAVRSKPIRLGGVAVNKIKVFVVEDDPVWADCLVSYLSMEPDMLLIGTAASKEQAVQAAASLDIDVMLLDMMLTPPCYDGLDAALDILHERPLKIIMLTAIDGPDVIGDAFAAGVVNYVTKAYLQDITSAIRDAYYNQVTLHPHAADQLVKEVIRLKLIEWKQKLTPTEIDILRLIAEGLSKKQIMKALNVSQNTVKSHIRRITKKFGVRTGKEAAEKLKRKGLFHE